MFNAIHRGPIALNKVSQQEKDAATASTNFTNSLRTQFQNEYGQAQGTQNMLTNRLGQVFNAAASGQGFTQPELTNLNTNNIENQANATQQANQATNRTIQQQGEGGGTTSGATAQLAAQNARGSAIAGANANRNIQLANAQQAQSNLASAGQGLANVAGQQSNLAAGLANTSVSSGSSSFNQTAAAFQPSNFWSNLGQGLLSGGLNALTGGISGAVTSGLGMLTGGGGGGQQNSEGEVGG